jgi:preprotein translocase subunit SecA
MIRTQEEDPTTWDIAGLEMEVMTILPIGMDIKGAIGNAEGDVDGKLDLAARRTEMIEKIMVFVKKAYDAFEEYVGDPAILTDVERVVCLRSIDDAWISHLENIGHLRHGIGLQGYGQRDPLVEYKKEAYRMFSELQAEINRQISRMIFRIQVTRQNEADIRMSGDVLTESGPAKDAMEEGAKRLDQGANAAQTGDKVGRNDLCPCGSGKKYKKCHGK